MGYPQKIVTCCYCGTRAALVLKGKQSHELACSRCGAPLHDLKMLPKSRKGDRELLDRPEPKSRVKVPTPKSYKAHKKRKKRKIGIKNLFEEAFDFIEDIFD